MKCDISKLLYLLSAVPLTFAGAKIVGVVGNYTFYARDFAADFAAYLTQFGILIGLGRILEILSRK